MSFRFARSVLGMGLVALVVSARVAAEPQPMGPATMPSDEGGVNASSEIRLVTEFGQKSQDGSQINVVHVKVGEPIKVKITLSTTRNDGNLRLRDDFPQIFANCDNLPVELTVEHKQRVQFLRGGPMGDVTDLNLREFGPESPFVWYVDITKMIEMKRPGTYRVIFGYEVSQPFSRGFTNVKPAAPLDRPFFILSQPLEIIVEDHRK